MKRILATAAATVMTLTALAGTATAAQTDTGITPAVSCYDGAVVSPISKTGYSPTGANAPAKTTTRCNDINVKVGFSSKARVCFYAQQKPTQLLYCQDQWSPVKKGTWVVVATNVRDKQPYRVQWAAHPTNALVHLAA
jgi:hypothetical protein